jgi:heme exporter protein A
VSSAPLLIMENVACIRGGRLLFEGMDLRLEAGAAAVVAGPNGVGKSSLLRVAAGLLRASAGTVARGSAWARLDGVKAGAGMELMGLLPLAKVPVRMLSTGQRKRAALARVVASGAPLWLLDEPANGLDSEGLDRLSKVMADHRARGGAILAASHQPLGLKDAATVALQ